MAITSVQEKDSIDVHIRWGEIVGANIGNESRVQYGWADQF